MAGKTPRVASPPIITIEVQLPYKCSTNAFYRLHYLKRHAYTEDVYQEVFVAVRNSKIARPEAFPVECDYHFMLTGKLLDTLNLTAMAKAVEDGLRHELILPDDTPEYVSRVTLHSSVSREKFDKVIVTLRQPRIE